MLHCQKAAIQLKKQNQESEMGWFMIGLGRPFVIVSVLRHKFVSMIQLKKKKHIWQIRVSCDIQCPPSYLTLLEFRGS